MQRHRGARTVVEAGGATGTATVVLALLSAGALAALGVVGAGELSPADPPQASRGSSALLLEPPASVTVTPPATAPRRTGGGNPSSPAGSAGGSAGTAGQPQSGPTGVLLRGGVPT